MAWKARLYSRRPVGYLAVGTDSQSIPDGAQTVLPGKRGSRRNRSVSSFETWLLALMAIGLVSGGWGIVWARTGGSRGGIYLGRGLFIATLLLLGVSGLLAARHRADGLAPLGLSA